MIPLLESIGELCAPLFPFVNGRNASGVITIGLLMTAGGILTFAAVSILRLRRTEKED